MGRTAGSYYGGRDKNVLTPEVSEEIKKKYSKQTVRDEDVDHSSDEEGYIPINKEMQRRAFVVEVNKNGFYSTTKSFTSCFC